MEEATRQKHGAMLIISEGAKDEADRLSQQSTPIKPMLMYPDLLNVATNIDGGVYGRLTLHSLAAKICTNKMPKRDRICINFTWRGGYDWLT